MRCDDTKRWKNFSFLAIVVVAFFVVAVVAFVFSFPPFFRVLGSLPSSSFPDSPLNASPVARKKTFFMAHKSRQKDHARGKRASPDEERQP